MNETGVPSGTAPRVALVVEDEWLVRFEIADILEEAGWCVLEAATGERAMEFVEEALRIDLLVTDIRLPGVVDGWEVAERLRRSRPAVFIIYCSASPPNDPRRVDDSFFLDKPCQPDVLRDHIAQCGTAV